MLDLDSKSPEIISNNIIELTRDIKLKDDEVFISSIITQDDNLNSKGEDVNNLVKSKCSKYGIGYIDNSDISTLNLNNSGLHLNHLNWHEIF